MENFFNKYEGLSIAVLGDYCLDEYLHIDAALNEPSLETGLVAYQCVKRETFPGAAGTIAKNLANLGVGQVYAVGYIGDDGRGLELRRGLEKLGVNCDCLLNVYDRITPTYTKPWITENGVSEELNRIDTKNWTVTPSGLEDDVMKKLESLIDKLDALIILDQMTEDNCGIITDAVRERLSELAKANPKLIVYADSRSRISRFNNMIIKGNQFEIVGSAFGGGADAIDHDTIEKACRELHKKTGKPVIVTLGAEGLKIFGNKVICDNQGIRIRGIPLSGQLDVTGAGDAFTAGFVSMLAAGADMEYAGQIGNISASICVSQIGTSGYITTKEIIEKLESSRNWRV